MSYKHGITIIENPTSIPQPVSNPGGVPVVWGTAPVNLAADPGAAVNTPILCSSLDQAKKAFGYSENYEAYSLCQAMDAFFLIAGISPVVLINVLDPEKHSTDISETVAVRNGQAFVSTQGMLKSSVVVKNVNGSETLVDETDYTLDFDDSGILVVTILTDNIAEISVEGKRIDPTKVVDSDIIGAYDAQTGKETGLEVLRQVYPKLGTIPGILAAPGWTSHPNVGLALAAKTTKINGKFSCECCVDIAADNTGATKYEDVPRAKMESGYKSSRTICLWPKAVCSGKTYDMSAIYAATLALADSRESGIPSIKASNIPIAISSTVLADGTPVMLDDMQANELNAAGVVTAINSNGFKTWGNNTAAYPGTTDPKDRWITVRRFFSWWGNSVVANYRDKIDDPMNKRLVESFIDSENVRGNSLRAQGLCAGARMEYRAEDNPAGNLLNGKIVFRTYLSRYVPAEDIEDRLEFDVGPIEAELGGE